MKNFLNWIPAFVVMAIIFTLSSIPGKVVDTTVMKSGDLQVLGHFCLYMVLCISYFKATKSIGLSVLLCLLYAISDELHQLFTPLRSSSLIDVGVDMLGVSISSIFLWKILPTLPKRLKNLLLK